jgi:hypothetical protein
MANDDDLRDELDVANHEIARLERLNFDLTIDRDEAHAALEEIKNITKKYV